MEFTEKDINRLIEERNRLAHENNVLYKKIDDLENEKCSDLKKYISVLEERLNNNSDNSNSDCEDLKQEIKKLHEELTTLYENDERYEKIFNQQKANIEKWKNKYEKTEIQLKEKMAEVEQLKLEKKGLKLEIENLNKKLNGTQNKDNGDCEKKYKDLRMSFDILVKEYEGATKSIRALRDELEENKGWKTKYLLMVNNSEPTKNEDNNSQLFNEEEIIDFMIKLMELMLNEEYDVVMKMMLATIKEARKKK